MLTLHGCQEDYFKSLKNFEKEKQNELNLRIVIFYPIKWKSDAAQTVNYNKIFT